MSPEAMYVALLFAGAVAGVLLVQEVGYRLGGAARRRWPDEKEAAVSAIGSASLGLAAFMLAFTFGIVFERYHSRRELVREDADAIRTAWMRSDFLPEPDRATSAGLLRRYVDQRLELVGSRNPVRMKQAFGEAVSIQRRLWTMAVANARLDMNSDVAALYIESLNTLANLHARRVSVALHWRIPTGIWLSLCALILLGMIGIGYQTAIAGSRRSPATTFMALAFSIVIVLIAALDRPESGIMTVTQQPLESVQAMMAAESKTP